MPRFTAIDLTGLSPPDIVETLDFEAILKLLKADVVTRMADFGVEFDVAMLESEPVVKVLEVAAYREILLRARVNTASRAIMLAFAQKHDLEHLGSYYGVERQEITPADPSTTPPTPAVMEPDARFRRRIQLAPEAFSTAGPSGAYVFHTLTADVHIKDVGVYMSSPGTVEILPLMDSGDGLPTNELLERIRTILSKPDIRPLTDVLNIRKPILFPYEVNIGLVLAEGPDPNIVTATALASVEAYIERRNYVGLTVYKNGLIQAAQVDGVENVIVVSPTADINPTPDGVGYATSVEVDPTGFVYSGGMFIPDVTAGFDVEPD